MWKVKGQRERGMLPQRLKDALNYELRWMTAKEIADYLNEDKDQVNSVAHRLFRDGEIERRYRFVGYPVGRMGGKCYVFEFRSLEVEQCPE